MTYGNWEILRMSGPRLIETDNFVVVETETGQDLDAFRVLIRPDWRMFRALKDSNHAISQ